MLQCTIQPQRRPRVRHRQFLKELPLNNELLGVSLKPQSCCLKNGFASIYAPTGSLSVPCQGRRTSDFRGPLGVRWSGRPRSVTPTDVGNGGFLSGLPVAGDDVSMQYKIWKRMRHCLYMRYLPCGLGDIPALEV